MQKDFCEVVLRSFWRRYIFTKILGIEISREPMSCIQKMSKDDIIHLSVVRKCVFNLHSTEVVPNRFLQTAYIIPVLLPKFGASEYILSKSYQVRGFHGCSIGF